YRLAEAVNLPVMVVLDAFFLSHTFEPVDVPDQDLVDRFLPPFSPRIELNTSDPFALGQMAPPTVYMEMRHDIQKAMEQVPEIFSKVEQEFAAIFGRSYGPVERVHCDDAQVIMVVTGTAASTCRKVISDLRSQGEKVGMLKFGASGIFAQEIRAALCNRNGHPPVFGYITGLGGRDVTPEILAEIYWKTKNSALPESESVWVGLNE
ncbi:MAG: pyruvate ferredoxin oxidoreductase, partial [Deltaproteobacteria bacterium]|nr:pyruvate ferredoxin oxidoreductase [Deltaproteobacteria bacterium]